MTRRTEVQNLLFDVELRPLFTTFGNREVPARDSLAVVDVKSERVVSVVGRGYRLVPHKEALDLAFDCAEAAFPETRSDHWQVMLADGPSTGGACFIDLAHNSAALDFSGLAAQDKPDVYGPFVRVTNSYNRTRALRFDIGFYRKVCKNGMILRDSLVSFKMNHQRREIGKAVEFKIAHEALAKQKQDFQAFLGRLQACEVPSAVIPSFACDVLGFNAPDADLARSDPRWVAWVTLAKLLATTSQRYEEDLGANAYAVLNVVTEMASRPPDNLMVRRDRHSLQRRAGAWASAFAAKVTEEGFDLGAYLESLKKRGFERLNETDAGPARR